MGSTKVRRSKTLPWPPVILAMISLPQRISQVTPPINNRTITNIILVMILRFLDTGFFTFLCLVGFSVRVSSAAVSSISLLVELAAWWSMGVSLAWSSPVCSSKLKAWVGERKSSAEEME